MSGLYDGGIVAHTCVDSFVDGRFQLVPASGSSLSNDWETTHGLNPNDDADGNQDRDGDGYTNLEEYLGALVGEFPQD